MSEGLTAVSLFSGVEGFGLAMERNGIEVVASVEIDKACRGVIAQHFPNSTIFWASHGAKAATLAGRPRATLDPLAMRRP